MYKLFNAGCMAHVERKQLCSKLVTGVQDYKYKLKDAAPPHTIRKWLEFFPDEMCVCKCERDGYNR